MDYQNITLRPATVEDEAFLYQVYASTRQEELAVTRWTSVEKEAFLQMQFKAQHRFYREHFRKADFFVIVWQGERIGRLYIDHRQDEIRLIDIALLPAYRNRGIGSYFMKNILAEGRRKQLPVRIHVEQFNPARRLYQRLGFYKLKQNGVYHLMEWSPDSSGDSAREKKHAG